MPDYDEQRKNTVLDFIQRDLLARADGQVHKMFDAAHLLKRKQLSAVVDAVNALVQGAKPYWEDGKTGRKHYISNYHVAGKYNHKLFVDVPIGECSHLVVSLTTFLGIGGVTSKQPKVYVRGLRYMYPSLPDVRVMRTHCALEAYRGPLKQWVSCVHTYSLGHAKLYELLSKLDHQRASVSQKQHAILLHLHKSPHKARLETVVGEGLPQVGWCPSRLAVGTTLD